MGRHAHLPTVGGVVSRRSLSFHRVRRRLRTPAPPGARGDRADHRHHQPVVLVEGGVGAGQCRRHRDYAATRGGRNPPCRPQAGYGAPGGRQRDPAQRGHAVDGPDDLLRIPARDVAGSPRNRRSHPLPALGLSHCESADDGALRRLRGVHRVGGREQPVAWGGWLAAGGDRVVPRHPGGPGVRTATDGWGGHPPDGADHGRAADGHRSIRVGRGRAPGQVDRRRAHATPESRED